MSSSIIENGEVGKGRAILVDRLQMTRTFIQILRGPGSAKIFLKAMVIKVTSFHLHNEV